MARDGVSSEEQSLIERVAFLERSVATLAPRLEAALARIFELERMAGARWLNDSERANPAQDIMLDELVIPMTMRLSASQGLHRLEYDGDGQPFRWTGPSAEFGFSGYVNRQRMGMIKLDVLWGGPTTDVSQTRCFVDDEEVVLSAERRPGGWTLTGVVPPRNTLRLTAFRFLAPEVFRVEPEGDLLGMAIQEVSYRARLRHDEESAGQ